jgi:hypothetical protein
MCRNGKKDKRFLLNYMFPHFKVNSGENELGGLDRVREAIFSILPENKNEKAAQKAKKGAIDPPSITASSSEEEV